MNVNTRRRGGSAPLRLTPGPHYKPVLTLLPADMPDRLDWAAQAAGYDSRAAYIRAVLERAIRKQQRREEKKEAHGDD